MVLNRVANGPQKAPQNDPGRTLKVVPNGPRNVEKMTSGDRFSRRLATQMTPKMDTVLASVSGPKMGPLRTPDRPPNTARTPTNGPGAGLEDLIAGKTLSDSEIEKMVEDAKKNKKEEA